MATRNKSEHHSKTPSSDFLRLLKERGLKASKARLALLQALSAKHCAQSVEELEEKLPRGTCDLATIYRNLQALEQVGLVEKLQWGDSRARYEIKHSSAHHHHHHLICRNCRKIEIIESCALSAPLSKKLARGFKDISHQLDFFGLCPRCQ